MDAGTPPDAKTMMESDEKMASKRANPSTLTAGTRPGSRPVPLLLWLLVLTLASCGPKPDPAVERGLVSLGTVELEGLTDADRSAITSQRAAVDGLLADKKSNPATLATALGDLGVLYRTSGRWEAARIAYGNAETLEPENEAWKVGRAMMAGAAAQSGGEWENADAAYREVVEADPDNLAAYRGLARGRRELGDLAGAYDVVNAALALAPSEGDSFSPEELQERVALLVQLGELEFTRGADEEGVAALTRALEIEPSQGALLVKIGDGLARMGRLEGAVGQYERYLELQPDDVSVREKYATALVNLGEGDAALAAFEAALASAPGDVGLAMRYAAALDYLDRADDATAVRERAREQATDAEGQAQLALHDGDAALARGQFSEAEALYRRAKQLTPESVVPSLRLARALGRQKRWDDAVAELDAVLAIAPRHLEARRGQIVFSVLGRRYDQARERLQGALKEYPRDAELALTQVRLLATVPDPEVADGALALAIAQRVYENQQSESTLEALALALAAAGNFEQAAQAQQALIDATQADQQNRHEGIQKLDQARLATYQKGEIWIARVPEEILVDLGI
jgi:superkiller protein 3